MPEDEGGYIMPPVAVMRTTEEATEEVTEEVTEEAYSVKDNVCLQPKEVPGKYTRKLHTTVNSVLIGVFFLACVGLFVWSRTDVEERPSALIMSSTSVMSSTIASGECHS